MGSSRMGVQLDTAYTAGQAFQDLPVGYTLFSQFRVHYLEGAVFHIQPLFEPDFSRLFFGTTRNQCLVGFFHLPGFKLPAQMALSLPGQSPDHQARCGLIQPVNHPQSGILRKQPGVKAVRFIRSFAGHTEKVCRFESDQDGLILIDQVRNTQTAAPQTQASISTIKGIMRG